MAKKQVVLNDKQTQMWEDIKNLEVEYYAIKNQFVANISEPTSIDPEMLYLTLKGPAALVSIEGALANLTVQSWSGKKLPKYVIEQREQFGCVMDNPEVKPPVNK